MMSEEDLANTLKAIELMEADQKLARDLQAQEQARRQSDAKVKAEPGDADAVLARALQEQYDREQRAARARIEADARLARELAGQSAPTPFTPARQSRDRKETLDRDTAFALELQLREEAGSSREARILEGYQRIQKRWEGKTAEERKKIEEALREIVVSPAVAGEYNGEGAAAADLMDAHKYTRTLIRNGIPQLTTIDDQFKLSSAEMVPEKVLEEVLTFLGADPKVAAERAEHPDFRRISADLIRTTFGHIAKNAAIDAAETQANAHHLLSRTWTLAKKMGPDYMAVIATVLSDNIGDKGSCIPGLIARLYSPYARMLASTLGIEAPRRAAAAAAAGR